MARKSSFEQIGSFASIYREKDMVLLNTASGVSELNPLWAICISHLLRKIVPRLFFVS